MRGRRRPLVVAVIMALAVVGLAACGDGDRGMSGPAAADLRARVARVRAAASAGDRARAAGELAGLRSTVERYRGQDQISAGRAAGVLAAVTEVEAHLPELERAPTGTSSTTGTTVRTDPPVTRGEDDGGKGKGEGGGKKGED